MKNKKSMLKALSTLKNIKHDNCNSQIKNQSLPFMCGEGQRLEEFLVYCWTDLQRLQVHTQVLTQGDACIRKAALQCKYATSSDSKAPQWIIANAQAHILVNSRKQIEYACV